MRNDWISVYVYSDLKFERVIVNLINVIVCDLSNLKYLKSYFFIRYWEGGEHLRLRVLANHGGDVLAVGNMIEEQATNYFNAQNDCQAYRIEFVPYEREIARYAGENGMKLSEVLFGYSSQTVISIIKEYCSVWNNGLAMAFAIKMHVIFLTVVVTENAAIAAVLKGIFENWLMHSVKQDEVSLPSSGNIDKVKNAFEKTFLDQRSKVLEIVKSVYNNDRVAENREWEGRWLQCCRHISSEMNTEDGGSRMHLATFCDNHIHMTNNRLGVYLRDESFIAFMLYRIFSEEEF
ncbi:thiopeptide-type bacteriocin biosynthesis protein [Dyadobacter arcticus]|nr:thiopeptide-type bacteriocin biosynthesis protein [Dyadobacter arcticus]